MKELEKDSKLTGTTIRKPLRVWPGIIILVLQLLIRFGLPVMAPSDDALVVAVFGGVLGGLALAVWWAFFSRAPRFERWGAIALIIIALLVTSRFLDKSIATANMGMMFTFFSIPVMSIAFMAWAIASRHFSVRFRRAAMAATILLASGPWALLRTNGMSSDLHYNFSWRWARTQEEKFLDQTNDKLTQLPVRAISGTEWPGFRGLNRDGIIHGITIRTDWKTSPPEELWRRQIGPGCSSFAVGDGLFYTQEQRGENEVVSCYDISTGEPVWLHTDSARFWDSHAGAGPRGTPTLCAGRLYSLGATGILNALDATDGTVIWSRNAATDTGAKDTGWGFTASPLVFGSVVIVAASGQLAAYDDATGSPLWFGPIGGKGYSSPQLMTIDGVLQVLLMNDTGATSFAPADGKLLWEYKWPMEDRVLQPAVTAEGDLLVSGNMKGLRQIAVSSETDGWKIRERWTSSGLKPNFNDFVVHKGYVYGFNGRSLACISAEDGKRFWQEGRYGGQLILLADQDLILVLSEKGELALVKAAPDKLTELARIPAITGKTWNHPVLTGNILLVRNSQEMAAFRLSLAGV